MLSGKNILVTGGCGFIGSNLAERLSKEGNNVKIADNLVSGKMENIKDIKAQFFNIDVRDFSAINCALGDIDLVFHEASNVFVQKSLEAPAYDAENNIVGTINLLEACRKNDVKRVVYASSCAIYGDPEKIPVRENHPLAPKSPYGISKRTAEEYCNVYYNIYGIETVCLRYFNVYGPRQDPSSSYSGVISIFIKNIISNKPIIVYGDGNQTRDFINVADVVDANILSAVSKKSAGKAINIGTGKETSLNGLIATLKKITGKDVEAVYKDARQGDIRNSVSDISLAKKILGFSPKVSLEDGLKDLLKAGKVA